MKSAGKVMVCTLCAVFTIGVVSASANWVEVGYDTTVPGEYGKIYSEFVDGKSTSNHKVLPVDANKIEWKNEGYELAYPHAGYDRLYLEGNKQDITRYNDTFAQWESRTKDYMWEMCWPYEIYQRLQTNIPGKGWTWDFYAQDDSRVFSKTNRRANVAIDFKNYGIADLTLDGKKINDDVRFMYASFLNKDIVPLEERALLSVESLSAKYDNGEFVVSDADIAANIEIIASKYLTGPAMECPSVRNLAQAFLANSTKGWAWDSDVVKIQYNAKIGWTAPLFEKDDPYYYYQFLTVNGLVLDGRNDTPRIYRYTGGKATPVITWKYAFAEKAYPYNIIEAKYINGVLATDSEGNPIYRIPTGEYANSIIKVTQTDIEIWITDSRGGSYKIESIPRVRGVLGDGFSGNAPGVLEF